MKQAQIPVGTRVRANLGTIAGKTGTIEHTYQSTEQFGPVRLKYHVRIDKDLWSLTRSEFEPLEANETGIAVTIDAPALSIHGHTGTIDRYDPAQDRYAVWVGKDVWTLHGSEFTINEEETMDEKSNPDNPEQYPPVVRAALRSHLSAQVYKVDQTSEKFRQINEETHPNEARQQLGIVRQAVNDLDELLSILQKMMMEED